MSVIPIILDSRPRYLGERGSLLLLPNGEGTLLAEIAERVSAVTSEPPLVLPLFTPDEAYEQRIRRAWPGVSSLAESDIFREPDIFRDPLSFRDPLARFDPSEVLLLVSPDCYPVAGLDLELLLKTRVDDARMLRHLLAFETTSLRTKEFVQPGREGRVRRIQRYFEPVTWPFPAGVIASLVPVACVLTERNVLPSSLSALRNTMAAHGVPSQDVPYHGRFFDLTDEAGALGFSERRVLDSMPPHAARSPGHNGTAVTAHGVDVHPTARLLGPVVLADRAVVEADALIIGPTLIGPGARVGRGAVVAQCLVGSGASIPERVVARQRVVPPLTRGAVEGSSVQRRPVRSAPPAPEQEARRLYHAAKELTEPLLALALLVVLSPLFIVVALLIKLTSTGPVFYGGLREGKDGHPFHCWKFRSMAADAHLRQRELWAQQQLDGPQFKMNRDPRVTPVGVWMRRTNIDELPQIMNVLRGEMSFVGPRPSPFRENQICVPWRQARLSVRPGITGLWQICRRDRAAGDFHQWIFYDLAYVRHASPLVDVKIILSTIATLGGNWPVPLSAIIPQAAPAASSGRRTHAPAVRRVTRTNGASRA